jgi:hypothetical protein
MGNKFPARLGRIFNFLRNIRQVRTGQKKSYLASSGLVLPCILYEIRNFPHSSGNLSSYLDRLIFVFLKSGTDHDTFHIKMAQE